MDTIVVTLKDLVILSGMWLLVGTLLGSSIVYSVQSKYSRRQDQLNRMLRRLHK